MGIKPVSLRLRVLAPLLLIAATGSLCAAWWEDCAFVPEVRSQIQASLLTENGSYDDTAVLASAPGFHNPISDWRDFPAYLIEAFTPGDRQRALFQQNYKDSGADLDWELNVITGYDHRWDDPGDYGFLYKGLRVKARLNDRFDVRGHWWNGRFHGPEASWRHSPLIDGISNQSPEGLLLDNINGDLSYSDPHFSAALGRGRLQIGNSISGSLMLSDRVNDYDFLLLEGRFGRLRVTFLNSLLQADSVLVAPATGEYPDKFFSAHQFSYSPTDWLEFFLGETVVYGKHPDLSYLLPIYFWRIGKYGNQNQDNLMLYGGLNLHPARDLTLYFNLALDELTYNKFYTNWWGNKYGVQAGAALQLPGLALTRAEAPRAVLEFTAIRPWMFTHYANVSMYSHDQRPLGYPLGANLLNLSAEFNLPLPGKLKWDSHFSCTWQGSEGNDWRLNYKDFFPPGVSSTAEAGWLAGEVSFYPRWRNTLMIGILAHHRFLLGWDSQFGSQPRQQFTANWQFLF